MRPVVRSAALAVILVLACASSGDTRRALDKVSGDLSEDGQTYGDGAVKAGEPVSCVQPNRIRQTRVRSDSVIDFEMDGKKVYRNVLPNSCPSLGFEEKFSYKTSINQLCSVDIITVLQSPGISQGASCGLGEFQPIAGRLR